MSRGERITRIPLADAPQRGEIRLLEVGGHRIGLFRVDDDFHALADRCPHRGGPLCSSGEVVTSIAASRDGSLTIEAEQALVRCPWHKWDFEIATGRCPVDDRLRVRRYAVRLERGEIVVTLDRPPNDPTNE
jgi:3-phenylpropionate/trans-cinnamate dioxygenase ferredoxin subunit